MAGTPLLSSAHSTMETLIAAMTTAGGYNYDWGTVNNEDMAQTTYPFAVIELEPEETNLDDPNGAHAGAYQNEAMFKITAKHQLSSEQALPKNAIKIVLLKMLDDLKKLFGINYYVGGYVDVIMYRRSTWVEDTPSADRFVPLRLESWWAVRYTQDRQTPTQIAS